MVEKPPAFATGYAAGWKSLPRMDGKVVVGDRALAGLREVLARQADEMVDAAA